MDRETLVDDKSGERSAVVVDGGGAPSHSRRAAHAGNDDAETMHDDVSADVDAAELELGRGPEIVGRYLLGDVVAAGGMAKVQLGRLVGAAGFARTVAVKRLLPHLACNSEFVERLFDEARIASRIRHANVVQTLDVVTSGSELLLVLDYVHGASLSRLVRLARASGESIPAPIAASILVHALRGLHAAHEATSPRGEPLGCVHRDVSPQNILVGADGLARVLDFGIAKAAGRLQETRRGDVRGKLAYMSPEQIADDGVDRRCDVFAAGIVLWEALAGERLFHRGDAVKTMHAIRKGEVPPLAGRVGEVSRDVDALLATALARRPGDRFPTADAMAHALEAALPPASDRSVALWMDRIAGPLLVRRLKLVNEFERAHEHEASRPALAAALRKSSAPPSAPARVQSAAEEEIEAAIRAASASVAVVESTQALPELPQVPRSSPAVPAAPVGAPAPVAVPGTVPSPTGRGRTEPEIVTRVAPLEMATRRPWSDAPAEPRAAARDVRTVLSPKRPRGRASAVVRGAVVLATIPLALGAALFVAEALGRPVRIDGPVGALVVRAVDATGLRVAPSVQPRGPIFVEEQPEAPTMSTPSAAPPAADTPSPPPSEPAIAAAPSDSAGISAGASGSVETPRADDGPNAERGRAKAPPKRTARPWRRPRGD